MRARNITTGISCGLNSSFITSYLSRRYLHQSIECVRFMTASVGGGAKKQVHRPFCQFAPTNETITRYFHPVNWRDSFIQSKALQRNVNNFTRKMCEKIRNKKLNKKKICIISKTSFFLLLMKTNNKLIAEVARDYSARHFSHIFRKSISKVCIYLLS